MNLHVTFRNLSAREEVRRRAEVLHKKIHRFLDPAADTHLTVAVEHGKAVIEMVVSTKGHVHKVVEEQDELRSALDGVFHRMENALRRGKERRSARKSVRNRDDDDLEEEDEAFDEVVEEIAAT